MIKRVRVDGSDDSNLNSDSTPICSAHWDGVEKCSRTHLPSIFLWSKSERRILYRSETTSNSSAKKRKTDISCTEMDVDAESVNEVSVGQIDVDTQNNSVSPTLSICGAETQTEITGEFLDWLELELKSTGEEKGKLAKEKDELTRDSKRLQHALKNPKFDISKFKEKDEDIEFYTGLPYWDALMLLYDMLHNKAQNLNYGSYAKKNTSPEQKLGRSRSMKSLFWLEMTLMRLRLGLFQKDLAHRFNVSETTVSTVFNTWVRFMSCFTVHSSGFSRGKISPGTSSSFSFTFSCFLLSSPPSLWLFELF